MHAWWMPEELASEAVSSHDDVADGVVLDVGRVEELIGRLAENARAAQECWSQLVHKHPPMGGSDDDVFDAAEVEEVEGFVFDALEAAREAWPLLDGPVLAYWQAHDPNGPDDDSQDD